MKPNQVLPELVIATLLVSLWFTPKQLIFLETDISRLLKATGLAASTVFYAKGYLMLVCNWNQYQSEEQKEEIDTSLEIEEYEYKQASQLAIKKLLIDQRVLEASVPIANHMRSLEPVQHPELSEQVKQSAARNAIEAALAPTVVESPPATVVSLEMVRRQFPESMDAASWKAICKASASGVARAEIVREVLGCNSAQTAVGYAYLDYLKKRFLDG